MKKLLVFLPFLISASWMSGSDITANQAGNPSKIYKNEVSCTSAESESCFDISSCPPAYCTIQDVQVDDETKPIYAIATQVTDCFDDSGCTALFNAIRCQEPNVLKFRGDLDEDGDEEIWCTRIISYQQKTIQALQEDATLKAAYDQAQADAQADKDRRNNARRSVREDWDSLTLQQKLDALAEAVGLR